MLMQNREHVELFALFKVTVQHLRLKMMEPTASNREQEKDQGAVSIKKKSHLTGIGIPMSHDRLIFNMGIPISGKDHLHNEMGPSWLIRYRDLVSITVEYIFSKILKKTPHSLPMRSGLFGSLILICPHDAPCEIQEFLQTTWGDLFSKEWVAWRCCCTTEYKFADAIVCHSENI